MLFLWKKTNKRTCIDFYSHVLYVWWNQNLEHWISSKVYIIISFSPSLGEIRKTPVDIGSRKKGCQIGKMKNFHVPIHWFAESFRRFREIAKHEWMHSQYAFIFGLDKRARGSKFYTDTLRKCRQFLHREKTFHQSFIDHYLGCNNQKIP